MVPDSMSEDPVAVAERRRIQNREAQRRYRENIKLRLKNAKAGRETRPARSRSLSSEIMTSPDCGNQAMEVVLSEPYDTENALARLDSPSNANFDWMSLSRGCDSSEEYDMYPTLWGELSPLTGAPAGSTVMHVAAQKGYHKIVRMLFKFGVDVAARDDAGQTSLHLAAAFGHNNTVLALLDAGVEVDAENLLGQTALFEAVNSGQESTVRLLLNGGADPNIKIASPSMRTSTLFAAPRVTGSSSVVDEMKV